MVRFTIFLIGGILLAIYFPNCINEKYGLQSLIIAVLLYLVAYVVKSRWGIKLDPGLLGLSIVFLLGYWLVLKKTETNSSNHLIHFKDSVSHIKVVLISQAQDKEKSWKMEARIQKVLSNKKWLYAEGKVLLYFSKEHYPESFKYGDVLLIEGSPRLLSEPGNPGEFDYKRFLSFRNIYHQLFIKTNPVSRIGYAPASRILAYAIRIRSGAERIVKEFVAGEVEQAIASALILGITDGLDNDIMRAYSASGALHVLAVSGLHVSILYGILILLLKPLLKHKSGKWIIAIVSLLVLWMYAMVTGLSPSVLRAVTMFSFIALARPLGWSTNIYNTLAASVFCLLLWNPYLIMSVGFQLSYSAVLGIVYLQRPIYLLWEAPGYWLDKIWQLSTVSIAAQLTTVALGLLYFHQFPVYFLFSNLFVIPMSFAVLISGLTLLASSWITPVAWVVGWLLTKCIQVMNGLVLWVENLPLSLLDDLYINTMQAWLIMIMLCSMFLLFQYKQFLYIKSAFILSLLLSGSMWIHHNTHVNQSTCMVYKVPGFSAVEFIEKGCSYFLADSGLLKAEEKIRFHIRPNRLMHEVKNVNTDPQSSAPPEKGFRLVEFQENRILMIMKPIARLPSIKVDLVIIGHNATSLKTLKDNINFDEIILDSSNSFYFAEEMLREAKQLDIKVYSVLHNGAFKKRL